MKKLSKSLFNCKEKTGNTSSCSLWITIGNTSTAFGLMFIFSVGFWFVSHVIYTSALFK